MKLNKREIVSILACAVVALCICFFGKNSSYRADELNHPIEIETGIVTQEMTSKSLIRHKINKLYYKGELIGMVTDIKRLDTLLDEIYERQYRESFPESNLELSPDVYYAQENSYFYYENKDDAIIQYLKDNNLFAIETNKIEFSNGAVIYVKNIEDLDLAKDQYLLNYVDANSLELISNNLPTPELVSYGERILDIQVAETYTVSKEYATVDEIMTNVKDIVYFFCYGYGTELKTYETEEFDTVEWVASQHGLSAQQLITLNSDILKTETQLLAVGTILNVTFFRSPINVVITKERVAKEVVYAPSTKYVANSSVREGMNKTLVKEADGSKNVYYEEVYINGELYDQKIISEEITLEPVREVIEYGTKVIPGVGTGKFRWPVNNPKVTCHWGCYNNAKWGYHRGVDIVDTKTKYGNVYAADRGTIEEVGYNSTNGNYVFINHNNGYRTYYGHMNSKCYFPVGANVEKGEVIGQLGKTGEATGVHVHFVIYTGKERHDACKWLGC